MINFSKIFLFILLILSLGLVLSACGNKEINQPNDQPGVVSEENQEQVIEEDGQSNEELEELSVSDWRVYENEYFNIKFKYHNQWYFHRVQLDSNQVEQYIAVYGFAPSLEELNKKDYAIQLFILNSTDNFTEDFSFFKERENGNKKYILVSNQEEYQEILNLMFENLEFLDIDTKGVINWNTYTNNRYAYKIKYPKSLVLNDDFSENDFSTRGPEKELIGGDTEWSENIFLHIYKIKEGTGIENFINKKHFEGITDIENITIASGEQGERYIFTSIDHPSGVKGMNTFLPREDKMYVFNLSNWDLKDVYELMLENLEFTK